MDPTEAQLLRQLLSTPSKIPGQPEELESANLVNIFNVGFYFKESFPSRKET